MVNGKEQQIKLLFRLEDALILSELFDSIEASKVYQSNIQHLPIVSEVAILYFQEHMKFGLNCHYQVEIVFQVGDVDIFINEMLVKRKTDTLLLETFIKNYNTNLIALESRITYCLEQKEAILTMFRHVVKHYWDSRLFGEYEKVMVIAKILTTFLHVEPSKSDKLLMNRTLRAAMQDYLENLPPSKNSQSGKKLNVKKPEDLTLTLDYSLDRNKHRVTYKLSSADNSIRIIDLFKQNLLDFLIFFVIDPLTLKSNEIKAGTTVTIEDSMWEKMGRKRTYHIDHINSAIRKHIESEDNFKCFSYKGKSIEVKICIHLVQKPAEEQFGNRKL